MMKKKKKKKKKKKRLAACLSESGNIEEWRKRRGENQSMVKCEEGCCAKAAAQTVEMTKMKA